MLRVALAVLCLSAVPAEGAVITRMVVGGVPLVPPAPGTILPFAAINVINNTPATIEFSAENSGSDTAYSLPGAVVNVGPDAWEALILEFVLPAASGGPVFLEVPPPSIGGLEVELDPTYRHATATGPVAPGGVVQLFVPISVADISDVLGESFDFELRVTPIVPEPGVLLAMGLVPLLVRRRFTD